MFQKRSTLWLMLFSGIIIHMICSSNLNIAITSMMKPLRTNDSMRHHACASGAKTTALNETVRPPDPASDEGEFDWTESQKGLIISSGAWFVGISKLFGGILCQRYGGKTVFGFSKVAVGVLSILMPTAAEIGVWAVVVVRALKGLAAGASMGTASSILISKWVPPTERGRFMASGAGMYAGISMSYFLNGWVIHLFGWRTVFYLSGALAFIWAFLWYFLVFDTPRQHPSISRKELMYIESATLDSVSKKQLAVPWMAILTSIPFLANVVANLGAMWTMYTFVLYMPSYLRNVHGLPPHMIGAFSSVPYLLETVCAVGFAAFTDSLLHRKVLSVTATRKFSAFLQLIVGGILVGFMVFAKCNLLVSVILLSLVMILNGTSQSGLHPNLVDLSPNFTAILFGLEGFLTSHIGYISPMVLSYLLAHNSLMEAWNKAFLVTSAVTLLPGLVFLVFGDGQTQKWNFENQETEKAEEGENADKMEH